MHNRNLDSFQIVIHSFAGYLPSPKSTELVALQLLFANYIQQYSICHAINSQKSSTFHQYLGYCLALYGNSHLRRKKQLPMNCKYKGLGCVHFSTLTCSYQLLKVDEKKKYVARNVLI